MKESSLNGHARDKIKLRCQKAEVYKLNDRSTGGLPDTVATWSSYTSWLEFKLLGPEQDIHQELKKLQLDTLIRLQRQSGGRAWVIAFRKAPRGGASFTDLYLPTALRATDGTLLTPVPERSFPGLGRHDIELLYRSGVLRLIGHDYEGIASLIYRTHTI